MLCCNLLNRGMVDWLLSGLIILWLNRRRANGSNRCYGLGLNNYNRKTLNIGNLHQHCRVVIVVLSGNLNKHIYLLRCITALIREDKLDVVILHLLKDTIGAEHEVVARADIRSMVDIGTRPTTHIGLHSTCDDVTLI